MKDKITNLIINACYEASKRDYLLRITIKENKIEAEAWHPNQVQIENALGFHHPSVFLNTL